MHEGYVLLQTGDDDPDVQSVPSKYRHSRVRLGFCRRSSKRGKIETVRHLLYTTCTLTQRRWVLYYTITQEPC